MILKNLTKRQKNIIGLCLIFSVIGYVFIRDNYHDYLLDNGKTKSTTAILVRIKETAVKSPASGFFKYKVKNKNYIFNENRDFSSMKIGDTLLIKYSLKNPSVARVVDKCYMQKYKGKCPE